MLYITKIIILYIKEYNTIMSAFSNGINYTKHKTLPVFPFPYSFQKKKNTYIHIKHLKLQYLIVCNILILGIYKNVIYIK